MSNPANSSGLLSAGTTQVVAAGRDSILHSVMLITDGTNAGNVVVTTGVSTAAADTIAKVANAATDTFNSHHIESGALCKGGMKVVVTGTSATAIIHYRLA